MAASDPAEARRWLDRARRLAPANDTVVLSLALACLRDGDAATAHPLFATLTRRFDLAEAWLGQAASASRLGDAAAATAAMQAVLSRHASSATARALAAALAGQAGWCALDGAGRLHADAPAEITLDGRAITVRWRGGLCAVPAGRMIAVTRNGKPLLGSPIDRQTIEAVEGCVAATAGGVEGWAWHPRNPGRNPVLLVDGRPIVARRAFEPMDVHLPLARPRAFRVPIDADTVTVVDRNGRPLLGSPVTRRLPTTTLRRRAASRPPAVPPTRPPVDVVIPVYAGLDETLACLRSVFPTLPPDSRVHVVDDAGPDPDLAAALGDMAVEGRIILHRLPQNRGFPIAANIGLCAAGRRDVVLLNSDTVVTAGWLDGLAAAAYSAGDIGSACPLSNDASILSYPDRHGGNPMPDPARMARLARQANGATTVNIPVAVGFCMFIRHDCRQAVGLLREDAFAQGYGEENDWCLRARHHGWRHVAAAGCFVAHRGATSFGAGRQHLLARNLAILNQLHPGYDAMIAAWLDRDPLGPARQRIDLLRWRVGRRPSAVVLVTQAPGGGVDHAIADRVAALHAVGMRAIVLRPKRGMTAVSDADMPNLRYSLPDEWAALLRLLRADRVERVELHHMRGHSPALWDMAARLGVPQDVFIHDYASLCPRITLVPRHRYCGEPPIAQCEACIDEHGSELDEPIRPTELVRRSAALLAGAARVIAPSADTATRIRRHFPTIAPTVTRLEDDASIPAPPPTRWPIRHICIVGAIGIEKGYDVLLGCVSDAMERRLPLHFTVVGFTSDDARLLAAGPVFITGRFARDEATVLIRQQQADLAFIPSIWPETWCFALGDAWRAGLRAAVFDLGAPAERVRGTGWGHLLPSGMPPPAINDWLLRDDAAHAGHAAARIAPSPPMLNPAV